MFPKHRTFISPFAGMATEFAFKERSKREILNDDDPNVYSMFAALRDERLFTRLVHLLVHSHDSRRLYEECFDRMKENDVSTLDRAYCFLVCGNLGFQGVHPALVKSYGTGLQRKLRLQRLLRTVYQWRDRMQWVQCENLDAFDLIDTYDDPDAFFYCDSPYLKATRCKQMYDHDVIDHPRFLKRLQCLKGLAMVCGYRYGLYDTQLHGWRRVSFPTTKSLGGRKERTETVWLNYDESGQRISQNLAVIAAFEQLQGDRGTF
jgi:DNA adenine methylase